MIKEITEKRVGTMRVYEGEFNEYTYKFIIHDIHGAGKDENTIIRKDIATYFIYNGGEPFRRVDLNGKSKDFEIFSDINGSFSTPLSELYPGFVQTLDTEVPYFTDPKKDNFVGPVTSKDETPEEIEEENVVEDEEEKPIDFELPLRIVSTNGELIEGVNVKRVGSGEDMGVTQTPPTGSGSDGPNIILKGTYTIGEKVTIQFSVKEFEDSQGNKFKYASKKKTIVTKSGKVREDISPIELVNKKVNLNIEKFKANLSPESIKEKWESVDKKAFAQKMAKKLLAILITKLTPIILEQLAEFGIMNPSKILEAAKGGDKEEIKAAVKEELTAQAKAKAREEGEKALAEQLDCPGDVGGLNAIIEKFNKLTKQLEDIYKKIEGIEKAIDIPQKLIDITKPLLTPLNVVINIMSWIPSTSFTPIPSGPVNKAAEGIIKLSDLITMAEHKISGITIHLETVLSHMKRVLDLLAMLDFLIQGCAEDLANAEDLVECTLPDGSIQMMTKEDCMAAGGSCCGDLIRGDLIKCTLPNGEVKLMTKEDCLAAGGICCGLILCTLPDGSVKPMLPEACLSAGGSFNNLIDCTLPDGTIQQMTKEDCLAAGGSCCGIGWKLTRGLGRLGPPKKPPPTPVSPYTDPKGSVWVYNDGELDLSNLGDGDGIGGQSDNQLLVQSQISQQILDSTKKQSNQLSPLVTNVNGFDMGIESEQHTKSLKRRRAIAKNKNEVVMLKGEWSFSADDQILIDELVFFIQQNDLKA